jgi:hypothetical protein
MKSNTDRDAPRRARPYTEIDDPMRQKVLKETELPNKLKSRTDSDEPKRAMPYTDIAAPTRKKVRKESDEPK